MERKQDITVRTHFCSESFLQKQTRGYFWEFMEGGVKRLLKNLRSLYHCFIIHVSMEEFWQVSCSSGQHRTDSPKRNIALSSACKTLICVEEFTLGTLHLGMRVCRCVLADIPFWLITHDAPAPEPLSSGGIFFQLSLGQEGGDWWYLGTIQKRNWLCPAALSFCG